MYDFAQLLDFAKEHGEQLVSATRAVQQAVEQAEANIRWLEQNHESIYNWLQKNVA